MARVVAATLVAAVVVLGVGFVPLEVAAALRFDARGGRWRLRLVVATPWRWPHLRLRLGGNLWPAPHARASARAVPSGPHRDGGDPGRTVRAVGRVVGALRVRRLDARCEIGTGDAASTAIACGVAWALGSGLVAPLCGLRGEGAEAGAATRVRVRLAVRPWYVGRRLRVAAAARLRLSLWQAARLGLSLVAGRIAAAAARRRGAAGGIGRRVA